MIDILDDLRDLHKQATEERSHYYVGSRCQLAIAEITRLRAAIAYVRQRSARAGEILNEFENT